MASRPPVGTQRVITDVVSQLSANSDVPYRATLAEAVAEFPVGYYFKSDDKAGVGPHPGVLWIYLRTAGSPFYVAQISGQASTADIDAAIAEVNAAAANALNYGNAEIRSGFVAADAESWAVGAWVQITSNDAGQHTSKAGDFGTSGGNTPNSGLFQEVVSIGLVRRAALESTLAAAQATIATAQAGNASTSATNAAASASTALTAGAKYVADMDTRPKNRAVRISASGQYVNWSTGAYVTLAGWDTISGPVRAGSTIRSNRPVTATQTGFVFRDAAGTRVGGAQGPIARLANVTVPAGAVSFEASFQRSASVPETGVTNADIRRGTFIWDIAEGDPYADSTRDIVEPGFVDRRTARQNAAKVVSDYETNARRNLFDPSSTKSPPLLNKVINGNTYAEDTLANWFTVTVPVRYGVPIYTNYPSTTGNPTYGPVWLDDDDQPIATSGFRLTATLTAGSQDVVVTAITTAGAAVRGIGILATSVGHTLAFPNGTFIEDAPAPGGIGAFRLSQPSTIDATGVTLTSQGIPVNAPVYPLKGAAKLRIGFNGEAGFVRLPFVRICESPFGAGGLDPRGVSGEYERRQALPLSDKIGGLFGDSIAASQGLGGTFIVGQTLEQMTDSYFAQISPVPGRRCAEFFNAAPAIRGSSAAIDAALIASLDFVVYGTFTNDFGLGRALGVLGDTAASNTFYGDLHQMTIAQAQTWNPALVQFLMTPPPRFTSTADAEAVRGNPANGNGVRLSAFVDAIIAHCDYYHLAVINLFSGGHGLNAISRVPVMSDGLHFNTIAGCRRYMLHPCRARMNASGA